MIGIRPHSCGRPSWPSCEPCSGPGWASTSMTASASSIGRGIASPRGGTSTVGGRAGPEEIECLDAVFAGQATVSRPRPSEVLLPDVDGKERLGLPTMFVLAPIRGDDGQVIAALGFRMRPERTFTRVLNVARFGRSGRDLCLRSDGAAPVGESVRRRPEADRLDRRCAPRSVDLEPGAAGPRGRHDDRGPARAAEGQAAAHPAW